MDDQLLLAVVQVIAVVSRNPRTPACDLKSLCPLCFEETLWILPRRKISGASSNILGGSVHMARCRERHQR